MIKQSQSQIEWGSSPTGMTSSVVPSSMLSGILPKAAWHSEIDTMARHLSPLTLDDLPELSRFLTAGFHTPVDADFAAVDVLRWKYLEQNILPGTSVAECSSSKAPRSYVARGESGQIIGHVGLCRTAFEGRSLALQSGRVPTIHIIDWLGSPAHRAVGISLMRKAHDGCATQFGLGVSQPALVVGERAGYELRSMVPVYARVLRAGYWLRTVGPSPTQRGLRLARDMIQRWTQTPTRRPTTLSINRVSSFGPEVDPITEQAKTFAILTEHNSTRLNAMLRFPRQTMTGWHLVDDAGRLRGLALLNVIPTDGGRTHMGKIVDCLLDCVDISLWRAAILTLSHELKVQGADLALAYASTPWTAQALRQSGFRSRFSVKFHIRDCNALIPRETTFHLTPLEGDYAYT
jgi:hypothetical protein